MATPRALLIEPCNFVDFPPGGQLTFARQLLQAAGDRFALVGCTAGEQPLGRWLREQIEGRPYDVLYFARRRPERGRPLVPERIRNLLALRRCREAILALGVRRALIQASEALLAVANWPWQSLCYCFPGTANPLAQPRYAWGRLIAGPYERAVFRALGRASSILAAGDRDAIADLAQRSRGLLRAEQVVSFPTRVDRTVFRVMDQSEARARTGSPPPGATVAFLGRLTRVKGWELVVEAFARLRACRPEAKLVLIGDGDQRPQAEQMLARLDLSGCATITGFLPPGQVAARLNCCDVVAFGSHHEGWSLAMLEALACGRVIVSPAVSGTGEMIREGVNGYVIRHRCADLLATAMRQALDLERPNPLSVEIAARYDLANLRSDLARVWDVMA